ncbi:hypothetical protein SAMN04487926_103114 [Paraburkholderia steynii]|uniref:Uncharacterized protein n=1 Tax=Paraburkholderia steynii TaxID=1245441 RepID=A0A7Z7FF35_9BURK|nr:hypothetical protein SAMN04487926_103114 [Paraburkholderia steynii]
MFHWGVANNGSAGIGYCSKHSDIRPRLNRPGRRAREGLSPNFYGDARCLSQLERRSRKQLGYGAIGLLAFLIVLKFFQLP